MKKQNQHQFVKKAKVFTLFVTLILFSFSINAQSIVAKHGRLQVQGNKILDKNSQPISLAGNSLFWSSAGGNTDYYNKETVNHLTDDWNSSVIRVAMGVKEDWDGGTGYIGSPALQEAKIRKVIDAAIAKGIYVIIDWHTHEAEKYQSEAITFFKKMARIYGDTPNVIYEIYNEPINQSWPTIKNYAEAVISAIRSEDSDNLIIVGTRLWSQKVEEAADNPIADNNVAYTIHFYAAFGPHQEPLRAEAQRAIDKGIALFATEWGTVLNTGGGSPDKKATNDWMNFLRKNGISHVNWSVADKNEGASIVQSGKGIAGLQNNQLTESGVIVRDIIKNWNPKGNPGITNNAPNVSFSAPNSSSITLQKGYKLYVKVDASDVDGSIANVQLFIDGNLVRQEKNAPYEWGQSNSPQQNELNTMSVGNHIIKVTASDNKGATTSKNLNVTVTGTDNGNPDLSNCSFGTPRSNKLPAFDGKKNSKAYVIGNGGPNLDEVSTFTINYDARYNGLYEFSFNTTSGTPSYYVDLLSALTHNFNASKPSISINGSGFAGLDDDYWVNKDGDSFVMVSKSGAFTIYFSNASSAPNCADKSGSISNDSSISAIQLEKNPVTNLLNFSGLPKAAVHVKITDLQGKIAYSKLLIDGENSLSVSDLNTGLYIAILSGDTFVKQSIKFTKQ